MLESLALETFVAIVEFLDIASWAALRRTSFHNKELLDNLQSSIWYTLRVTTLTIV